MEKEEKVIVILLSMILLSLSVSYVIFFSSADPQISAFSTSSVPGDNVFVDGSVLSKRFTYSGNHLILVLDSVSGPVKIFIPSGNGADAVDSMIMKDSDVRIFGTVDEYEGELEIIVRDEGDVTVY